jgi:hypothetical protein
LGFVAYTDFNGIIQLADQNVFLDDSNCLDNTGQLFSTGVLPVGTTVEIPLVGGHILFAGAPLGISGVSTANTGVCMVTITLRPKDLSRGDASKRPGGSADYPYPLS